MSARAQSFNAGITRQPELPGTQPCMERKEGVAENSQLPPVMADAKFLEKPTTSAILVRYCCSLCGVEGSFARRRGSQLSDVIDSILHLHDLERRCLNRDISLFPQPDGSLWVKIVPDLLAQNGIPPVMTCEDF